MLVNCRMLEMSDVPAGRLSWHLLTIFHPVRRRELFVTAHGKVMFSAVSVCSWGGEVLIPFPSHMDLSPPTLWTCSDLFTWDAPPYMQPIHIRAAGLLLVFFLFTIMAANEVWGKVIFLHLSVILFTGGGCLPLGSGSSASGSGGFCLWVEGGVCLLVWGGYTPGHTHTHGQPPSSRTPLPLKRSPWTHPPVKMAIEADGTHPTGIHSCLVDPFFISGEVNSTCKHKNVHA